MIKELRYLLNKNEIHKLVVLTIMAVITSVSEVFGLSIIVPFMAMATDTKMIETNKYLQKIYAYFGFNSHIKFIAIFGGVIVVVFLLKNILNVIFNYSIFKFNRDNYYNITNRLMKRYLRIHYEEFISGKSSDLAKNILNECNNLMLFIQSVLFVASDAIIIGAIYLLMLYVSLKITIFISIFLVFNIYIVKKFILNKIEKLGGQRNDSIGRYYEGVEKTFSNYKYIKLLPDEDNILKKFRDDCKDYVEVEKKFFGMQPVPKNILEFLGFLIVILLIIGAMITYGENGIQEIMPVITLFFIALYRILPTISRVVLNYQYILYFKGSLHIIVKELKRDVENLGDEKISFEKRILLENIRFKYGKDNYILDGVNLEIKKGDRIAFIGESGAGKTTLADIVIGLYECEGSIYIDDLLLSDKNRKSWRGQIGYIPQDVTLFYGSVKDNVVFGRKYNKEKLELALKKARIWDFLSQKDGVETIVGDKGKMLSGGQKQRIGIARALYDDPEILVLDEATSALDNRTEKEIMEEIYSVSQSKTLIIVAHRLSTLEGCNRIIKLYDKKAVELDKNINEIIREEQEKII